MRRIGELLAELLWVFIEWCPWHTQYMVLYVPGMLHYEGRLQPASSVAKDILERIDRGENITVPVGMITVRYKTGAGEWKELPLDDLADFIAE